jgi:hypothetical protein
MLAGDYHKAGSGRMIRGDMKISLKEIEEFMQEISPVKAMKITRRELVEYLRAFPQKTEPGKDAASELKQKKQEANFLMNGQSEMEAKDLYELL